MDTKPLVPGLTTTPLLMWTAPTKVIQERGRQWYLIGGIIVIVGASYGILTGSWSFAVVALLCGAVYVLLHGHVPAPSTIALTEYGIYFQGYFTSYNDLKSFWLFSTPLATELHIARKGRGKEITILTGGMDPALIQGILSRFVPEDSDRNEHLLDAFIRICKL